MRSWKNIYVRLVDLHEYGRVSSYGRQRLSLCEESLVPLTTPVRFEGNFSVSKACACERTCSVKSLGIAPNENIILYWLPNTPFSRPLHRLLTKFPSVIRIQKCVQTNYLSAAKAVKSNSKRKSPSVSSNNESLFIDDTNNTFNLFNLMSYDLGPFGDIRPIYWLHSCAFLKQTFDPTSWPNQAHLS